MGAKRSMQVMRMIQLIQTNSSTSRCFRRATALAAALLSLTLIAPLVVSAATPYGDKKKKKPDDALIYGSVFTEEGFALRGATVRIRHKDHKKPKWKTETNSRGEFAVRLPRSSGDYELVVSAKSYESASEEFTITIAEQLKYYFRLKHPKPPEKNPKEDETLEDNE